MQRVGTVPVRQLVAWLLMAAAVGLLVWDLDDVPAATLALALAAFLAGATMRSRSAR